MNNCRNCEVYKDTNWCNPSCREYPPHNNVQYAKINWSPFATNVLDAGDFELCKPDGTPVDFHRSNGGFVLVVDGQRLETDDNIQMSYWMNQREIGGIARRQND